jgi:hypothetical protein
LRFTTPFRLVSPAGQSKLFCGDAIGGDLFDQRLKFKTNSFFALLICFGSQLRALSFQLLNLS